MQGSVPRLRVCAEAFELCSDMARLHEKQQHLNPHRASHHLNPHRASDHRTRRFGLTTYIRTRSETSRGGDALLPCGVSPDGPPQRVASELNGSQGNATPIPLAEFANDISIELTSKEGVIS
jgi:hypothetical protein